MSLYTTRKKNTSYKMAMSKSVIRAQDIMKCQLCENNSKLEYKCIDCNLLICDTCRHKIHPKIKDADKHRIINIKDVGATEVSEELDFRNIPCVLHPGQSCCLYCTRCEKLVCPTCIAMEHAGHRFSEIQAYYTEVVKKLDGAISELDAEKKELDIKEREVILFKENEKEMFSKLNKEIETQRQAYKNDIDKHFDKIVSDLQVKMNKVENSADKDTKNISDRRNKLAEVKTAVTTLKSTRDASEFFTSTQALLAEVKVKVPVISSVHSEAKLKFVPKYKHLPGKLLGTLEEETGQQVLRRNLDLRVKKEYTTELDGCHHITACSDGSYFIAQFILIKSVITKIQIQGDSIKTIFTKTLPYIADIDTPPGSTDILLADITPTLKVMNGSTGDISKSQYQTGSLGIIAVHVTMDNKVVVGAVSPGEGFPVQGRRVVMVMDMDGKHQAEWEYNQRGDRLFSVPRYIASTRNGNVYVGDMLSSDNGGRVITMSPRGDVLNTYTGHPDINNKQHPFKPAGMTRTPSDNVIICDYNNHALHLLNNAGVPLSYYNTYNIGIIGPFCVTFDTKDQDILYIGCTTPDNSTEKAKLYKVNCTEVQ